MLSLQQPRHIPTLPAFFNSDRRADIARSPSGVIFDRLKQPALGPFYCQQQKSQPTYEIDVQC